MHDAGLVDSRCLPLCCSVAALLMIVFALQLTNWRKPGASVVLSRIVPGPGCSGYTKEIEAFIVRANPLSGLTFEGRQCSKATDHIIVPGGSSDMSDLQADGYDCTVSLGYFYNLGSAPASGHTPWKNTCSLWRFRYETTGGGAHFFTRGADNTSAMTCEVPARAQVFSDEDCFSGTPSGC
jgi:hypothetical protein